MALNRLVMRGVRSQWRPASVLRCHSTPSETDEYIVFPRERAGMDISLNWSLNKNGVTPLGDAYRWTKAAQATQFGAKADKVSKGEKSAPEAKEDAASNELGFVQFDAALFDAKEMLTTTDALFVAEATAITGILHRMPRSPDAMVLPITCYVSEKGQPFAGFIVEAGDGVVYDENDTVASVVMTGSEYSPGKLLATIEQAAVALTE